MGFTEVQADSYSVTKGTFLFRNSVHPSDGWLPVHADGRSRRLARYLLPVGSHFRHGGRVLAADGRGQALETVLHLEP